MTQKFHGSAGSDKQEHPGDTDLVDLVVIGGGVNGAGIARDAAGRSLKVVLVEQGDLAQGTSSRSGKLVHGGLRYLEYFEFRLVREALIEREVLLNAAPHIIWPMRFVLPHSPGDRPAWLVRAGLFLYDYLGGRKRLASTRSFKLHSCVDHEAIKPEFKRAFEYSDCWVDDARLTVLNAVGAHEKGATVLTRTRCLGARRHDSYWLIDVQDCGTQEISTIKAKGLVNAAGPWVKRVLDNIRDTKSARGLRLVKGSHLVMRKFWEGEHSYLIQNDDKRVIFVNPYEKDFALVGTTDIPYEGSPEAVEIDQSEVDYLLKVMNRYFVNQFNERDVLSSFSGVRPLYDDDTVNPSQVTRDYIFDIDDEDGKAPVLSVFGGKITTYRKLSEHALQRLIQYYPRMGSPWTADEPLPGGDMDDADFTNWLSNFAEQKNNLPFDIVRHYVRLYGTRSKILLSGIENESQLGLCFGHTLYEIEVRYLVKHEWARTAEDVLERRTKHGLHLSEAEKYTFDQWFDRTFSQVQEP